MCDYGVGKNLAPEALNSALENVLRPSLSGIKTILFGSYGSIMDEYEISDECFDSILNFANGYDFENVIFETHYSTVTSDKLKRIKKAIRNKSKITIEMGYESCDDYILSECLGKVMNLKALKKAIELIHSEGMDVCLNVFIGAPFVSVQDQTMTAVDSVKWAFLNGADSVVLFPSNIKPFTLLYDLYKAGHYSAVPHWQVIDVLERIPSRYLGKISLSWFGDRKNFYENNSYALLPPEACDKCRDDIFYFYHVFRKERDGKKRKSMLKNLRDRKTGCLCQNKYINDFKLGRQRFSPSQIEEIISDVKGGKKKSKELSKA